MHWFTPLNDQPQSDAGSIHWRVDGFDVLSVHSLYQILKARVDVFVVEQNCPYPELDDEDQSAQHVQGYSTQGLAAYARILPPDPQGRVFIGRVITTAPYRGQGIGHALLEESLRWASEAHPTAELWLSAQAHLKDFYGQFGFEVCGEGYLEDGIPHLPMRRLPQ